MARRDIERRVTEGAGRDHMAGYNVPVSSGGGVLSQIGGHIAAKAAPYTPPWIGAATLPPLAGWGVHAMWGETALSAGLASAGMGIGAAVLSAVTWTVSGGTNKFRRFRRAQATASVAGGMGWLTCSISAGPFGHPMTDLWLLGGGLFAASWNVRQLMRNAHDETEETTDKGVLGKLAEAIGLEKVQVTRAKGNGKGMVTADVAVPPGKTMDDVQAAAPKLAAALQVPPSAVTVKKDPHNAGRGSFAARVADLLQDGVPFLPPRELGLLPTEPIPVGLYADGEEWSINPFLADILQHLLIMGVTGSGKSEFARAVLAHLMTRRKLSIWLIDLAKGEQTLGHMAEGLDWFVNNKRGGRKEAKLMLKSLPGVISARGDELAEEGLDQWTPKSKLNAMVVWVEEAADIADFDVLDEIARKARSVGIWLVVSLQRATWTNLSTDVRANLQASACFGVDEAGDASFVLPDRVTDSGAIPDWGSDRPGYGYATGMGIPTERWTTEVRGSLTKEVRDQIREMILAAAPYRDPLDDISAAAAGLAYAQRTHHGTNRTNVQEAAAPAPARLQAVPGPQDENEEVPDTEEEEAVAMEIDEIYTEVMAQIPGDPEPDADYARLSLDDDVPDPDADSGIAFEQSDKPSTEQARAILYGEIDGWAARGRLTFETGDLIPAAVAAGRKRGWLQNELKKLTEDGALQHDAHGEYSIVRPLTAAA
ncbi:helicase HerA domain-containing protein [Streptomyces lydicus]|uniref:helicase HerA domain-containing protein n=1 Tax=Streptomyces lydicus TaxID=47763 RepID=UPI0036FC14F7